MTLGCAPRLHLGRRPVTISTLRLAPVSPVPLAASLTVLWLALVSCLFAAGIARSAPAAPMSVLPSSAPAATEGGFHAGKAGPRRISPYALAAASHARVGAPASTQAPTMVQGIGVVHKVHAMSASR